MKSKSCASTRRRLLSARSILTAEINGDRAGATCRRRRSKHWAKVHWHLKATLHEAFVALEKGSGTRSGRRADLHQAQAALIDVNRYLEDAVDRFRNEVTGPASRQVLAQMAGDLGGEWPQWLAQINSIIATIRDKSLETWRALCQCWEELADKLSSSAVSVQTTNIGQQITAPEMRETVLEGMT